MEPKLYIGASEVTSVDSVDGSLYKIKLADGRNMEFTPEQWISAQSEEPYDEGLISIRKFKPVLQKLLEVFLNSNIKMGEKNFILERLDESLVQNYRAAVCKKLGVDHQDHVSLKMIDEILKA